MFCTRDAHDILPHLQLERLTARLQNVQFYSNQNFFSIVAIVLVVLVETIIIITIHWCTIGLQTITRVFKFRQKVLDTIPIGWPRQVLLVHGYGYGRAADATSAVLQEYLHFGCGIVSR